MESVSKRQFPKAEISGVIGKKLSPRSATGLRHGRPKCFCINRSCVRTAIFMHALQYQATRTESFGIVCQTIVGQICVGTRNSHAPYPAVYLETQGKILVSKIIAPGHHEIGAEVTQLLVRFYDGKPFFINDVTTLCIFLPDITIHVAVSFAFANPDDPE